MAWARFDDRYDDHPKLRACARRNDKAAWLHPQAITAASRHETDGLVDPLWLEDRIPVRRQREAALAVLVELGLFDELTPGEVRSYRDRHGHEVTLGPFPTTRYIVHDYLEYNFSSAYLTQRRRSESERKARGIRSESERKARGVPSDSERYPTTPSHPSP